MGRGQLLSVPSNFGGVTFNWKPKADGYGIGGIGTTRAFGAFIGFPPKGFFRPNGWGTPTGLIWYFPVFLGLHGVSGFGNGFGTVIFGNQPNSRLTLPEAKAFGKGPFFGRVFAHFNRKEGFSLQSLKVFGAV